MSNNSTGIKLLKLNQIIHINEESSQDDTLLIKNKQINEDIWVNIDKVILIEKSFDSNNSLVSNLHMQDGSVIQIQNTPDELAKLFYKTHL